MRDVIEIAGAGLVLVAYALYVSGRIQATAAAYLALNLVGAATLAVIAALGSNWGFLLLQGVWAIVSAATLARQARARWTT